MIPSFQEIGRVECPLLVLLSNRVRNEPNHEAEKLTRKEIKEQF
jgi:hypothetical protein